MDQTELMITTPGVPVERAETSGSVQAFTSGSVAEYLELVECGRIKEE
jgi:hypothetical protein